jgi:hypothetical protein
MKHTWIALLAVILSIFPASAFAEGKADGKDTKKKGKFPMTAQEFRASTGERIAKARGKMEDKIKGSKMSEDRAKVLRARFESVSTKVGKAVTKVTADGSVTREEFKEVTEVAREARREAAKTIKFEKRHDKKDEKKAKPKGTAKKSAKDSAADAPN